MAEVIRTVEKSLGIVYYGVNEQEAKSLVFRRSLFVVRDMKAGDIFTEENVRSIRPGYGLPPKHLAGVLGRAVTKNVSRGTPLTWGLVSSGD
jgi:N-acetylneuraminate synthase